ncbi:MAG TPA: MMPL family transporter [Pirellulales bacterium]|jgi:RND superfamily putative drug exporter|nr:MMPL family transporter [Pirellulales bacterium]
MFDRIGNLVSRYWILVVAVWIAVATGLHFVAPHWDDVTNDGDLAYMPESMPSVEGEQLLRRAFPENHGRSEFAVVVERPNGALTNDDLRWSDRLAELFRDKQKQLGVVEIWNRNTDVVGDQLLSRISKSGQATVTLLRLKNEFMAVGNIAIMNQLEQVLDQAKVDAPGGLRVGLSGSAAVGGDMLRSAAQSIKSTEWITIALVILILFVVYRAPLLVSIPLVTIGVSLVVSTSLLALATQFGRVPGFGWWNFKIFTTTKIFIVVILFGAGTDFCLFLISRYKEELERGLERAAAATESVGRVGHALVASAMTTICGLATMYFADFGKFRNSGPAIAVCLAITLLACLTLAPALLRAGGRHVFWPMGLRQWRPGDEAHEALDSPTTSRFWEWASRVIIRHPGLILMVSILALMPLFYAGLDLKISYDFLNELDPSCVSVQGAALAKRHFPPGDTGPLTILAYKPDAHFDQPEGEHRIERLTKQLYELDGVESVRSMAEPTGDRPGYFQPFRSSGLKKLAARRHKITKANYLTQTPELVGKVARFDVILDYEPFSPKAVATLERIERYLDDLTKRPQGDWTRAHFARAGTTVGIRDLAAITSSDRVLIERLVVICVLGVLIVLLRRPLVCVYLILSVLFSYVVTIGVTQLAFAWWYADVYQGLDWKVPIFLFVILIAVGEDYNIYLVTRVVEEQKRHGPIEGLRRAVARTGGIITSCGVIMAGTFISMMSGSLRGVLELGFALSLGVMLDTCIVRPVLVPAFMALVEEHRWFGPRGPASPSEAETPAEATVG